MSSGTEQFSYNPQLVEEKDVEMVQEDEDEVNAKSEQIIKINYDLSKGSADNIEVGSETAMEQHFGVSAQHEGEEISMPKEEEPRQESKKGSGSNLTTHTHSTDGGSPPTSQTKTKGVAKLNAYNQGRWSEAEHKLFMEGIDLYGKDWKKVEDHVGTRSSTQARSHAQKVLPKLEGYNQLASPKKSAISCKRKESDVQATFEKCSAPVF